MLYEIRLTVTKTGDDGAAKTAREHYICDAELHAEAEQIGYSLYPGTDADVTAVGRSDVKEIINSSDDGDYCYKATVVDVITDESGREKELKYPMLVFADSFSEATERMKEHLRQGYDMTLDCLRRVRILDYIRS